LTGLVELRGEQIEQVAKRAHNLVISTDDGKLLIYGVPPFLKMEKECEVMPSHIGKINCIKRSFDHKILVTCGEDSTIFIYRVSDCPNSRIGLTTRKTASRIDNLEAEAKRSRINKETIDSIAHSKDNSIDQQENIADIAP